VSDVALRPVNDSDREVLDRLFQLYQHDLSEFRGTWPDAGGRYPSSRLGQWLELPDTVAYLIVAGDQLGGFAVVRSHEQGGRSMGEFFVVRGARRGGIGAAAARAVLERHPGPWHIAFQEANAGAARFWRRLVTQAGRDVREERLPVPGKPHLPPDTWLRLTV
jgi:predicted acetyltransferase